MATTEAPAADAKPARTRTRSTQKTAEAAPPANRVVVTLVPAGSTRRYSKWQFPEDGPAAGNVYAPLGATDVKVAYTKP